MNFMFIYQGKELHAHYITLTNKFVMVIMFEHVFQSFLDTYVLTLINGLKHNKIQHQSRCSKKINTKNMHVHLNSIFQK
jgi:hypothetical protein